MDVFDRIKAFHSGQFEDVETCAPVFRGSPIHEGMKFHPDVGLEEIFKELQTSAKASGYVLTKKRSKKIGEDPVFQTIKCHHAEEYVFPFARGRLMWA